MPWPRLGSDESPESLEMTNSSYEPPSVACSMLNAGRGASQRTDVSRTAFSAGLNDMVKYTDDAVELRSVRCRMGQRRTNDLSDSTGVSLVVPNSYMRTYFSCTAA